jgi:hypothetical protein
MRSLFTIESALIIGVCLLSGLISPALDAQFVREDVAAQTQQSSAQTSAQASAQDPPAASLPSGKLRVSQEVQLTGDSSWLDTGIDVQPGDHVVATTTGSLRYADQQSDTAPAGMARGFKDLLRSLPFNDAGRGAVIGRIGDADTSQPFLIGTGRDLVSPISGRLSIGINQLSSDTGDGTYTVQIDIYAADANSILYTASTIIFLPGYRVASPIKPAIPATWSTF